MDSKDYRNLDRFINLTISGEPERSRSAIMALHNEPCVPGYSSVLVVYSRSYYDAERKQWVEPADGLGFRVALYGYTPESEGYGRYNLSRPGEWTRVPAHSFEAFDLPGVGRQAAKDHKDSVKDFEDYPSAMKYFAEQMTEFARTCC